MTLHQNYLLHRLTLPHETPRYQSSCHLIWAIVFPDEQQGEYGWKFGWKHGCLPFQHCQENDWLTYHQRKLQCHWDQKDVQDE